MKLNSKKQRTLPFFRQETVETLNDCSTSTEVVTKNNLPLVVNATDADEESSFSQENVG